MRFSLGIVSLIYAYGICYTEYTERKILIMLKSFVFTCLLFSAALPLCAQKVAELETARDRYAAGAEKIATEHQDALIAVNLKYRDALAELRKGFVGRGDLAGVKAVDAELAGLDAGALPETAGSLERPRQIFEKLMSAAMQERDKKLEQYRAAYVRHLTAMVAALTKAERIADAMVVHAEMEGIAKNLPPPEAAPSQTAGASAAGKVEITEKTSEFFADLSIVSSHAIEEFKNNTKAWGNRGYSWTNIPSEFENMKFTRQNGGGGMSISITVKTEGKFFIATHKDENSPTVEGLIFNEERIVFYYGGKHQMKLYSTSAKPGKYLIPSGDNWAGNIVIFKGIDPGPQNNNKKLDIDEIIGKLYASCDGDSNFDVYVNGLSVFSSEPKRGARSPDFKLRPGDLIVVRLSATSERFDQGRQGFVAWLVLDTRDGSRIIVPGWRSSRASQLKDVKTDQGTEPKMGFNRTNFQGYFRDIKAVQQIQGKSVWPQKSEGFLVYKLNMKDAVPVID
ncbi:MAG: hypothetical protein BWY71_00529 [Planctomycetes bacterium ADurb.Bin412]|nr:MAG: hypothetical protein BWY71_00529 [Planctomycetes bacterium ADurb.Bin412]